MEFPDAALKIGAHGKWQHFQKDFFYRLNVCDHYFGQPRQKGSSHRVYKTPWQGDPRVNIQNAKGKAKAYQVRQVLRAIERLEYESHSK
jgi:hypothetical protein